MYSLCVPVLFALGTVAVISGIREISDGAVCTCDDSLFSSTLRCSLATPSDFVNVTDDYCGIGIKAVEIQFLHNSYVSTINLPSISVFRLRITGGYLKEILDNTFVGYEDSLRFVEITHGALTKVPSAALHRLRRLESLILDGNSINSINCSLKDTPLKNMVLSDNEISLVHSCAFPQSLRALSLKNNLIERLNGSLKQLSNLTWLFIERNRITRLDGELQGLDSLSLLDASWNKITTFGTELVNLLGLSHLNLSHNRISKLGNSLNGFVNLFSLDLSYNDLESLSAGMFDGLKNLRILHLTANSIRYLDDRVFKRLVILKSLIISDNVITSLEGKLDGMRSLSKLDASRNNIRTIGKAFRSLTALEELELPNNQITDLENTLSTLSQLKCLDLMFNELKEVNENVFIGVKNLQKLNLSYNNLRRLNGTVFASLTKLATLDLSYNHLQSLSDFMVPGFMNISLPTADTTNKPDKCNCKRSKSLVVIGNLRCIPNSEVTKMMAVLHENDIEVVGC